MIPDPNKIFPREDVPDMTLVRPTITRPNIEVGEYTYFSGRDLLCGLYCVRRAVQRKEQNGRCGERIEEG